MRQSVFNITLLVFLMLGFLSVSAQDSPIQVQSLSELQQAVNKATPGTIITLLDGIYDGQELTLSNSGTPDNSIIIRSAKTGGAIIHTPVKIKADYVSLVGLNFEQEGSIEIEGKGNRISRCTMQNVNTGKWLRVLPGSSEIEIDYNTFENKQSNLTHERGCQLMQIVVRNQNERHHIHHNLFQDIPRGSGNGFETLQLITENNPFDPPPGSCNSLIENNLFIRCNGESEIISVKSNGNVLRGNVFRESRGALVLRHGDNNKVLGNFFFGDGEEGSGGIRLQGTGQIVANNYLHGLGSYGLGMMDGTPDDLYIRVEGAKIVFNTLVDCNKSFQIGLNHSKHPNGTAPKDCLIRGNIFYRTKPSANSPDPFLVFVQNDQPENWVWEGNIANGSDDQRSFDGFSITDPNLNVLNNRLAVPTKATPKVVLDPQNSIVSDLLGTTRKKKTTAGAIQYKPKLSGAAYLDERSVGPQAFVQK